MKSTVILMVLVALLVLIHVYSGIMEGFESVSKTVVICKASWCGHCKDAAPEFDKLLAASPIPLKKGGVANVKILDADTDKDEIAKYKIKGYPTILIVEGDNAVDYPGERTSSGVIDFLNNM